MKEEKLTHGYRINPFIEEDSKPEEREIYIEVILDDPLVPLSWRNKIYFPGGMSSTTYSISETRQLMDALDRGMKLLANHAHEKLKQELKELQEKAKQKGAVV